MKNQSTDKASLLFVAWKLLKYSKDEIGKMAKSS